MNFLNIKYKLLFLSVVPILLTLVFSFVILSQSWDEKKNYELTKQYALKSSATSKVIHYLQIERGLSIGFLAKNNLNELDKKLLLTKKELDKAIKEARDIYKKNYLSKDVDLLKLLNKIEIDRRNMDLNTQNVSSIEKYYSQKIDTLLNYIATIPTFMEDREDRNYIQALVYLSNAKESLAIIRTTINKVFIEKELSKDDYTAIKGALKNYSHNIDIFKKTVPDDFLQQFKKVFTDSSIDNTFAIIELTIADTNSEKKFTTDPDLWFEESSQIINLLNNTENSLLENVNKSINSKLHTIFYKLFLLVLFLVIGIVALIVIATAIVKNILASTNKLSEDYSDSLSLLKQYKSSVDRSFIVSKTDKEGIITYVNDEFCKISGYSRDELIGNNHNIIRHPDMNVAVFKDLWHTIKDKKEPWFGEIHNQKKDKSSYWTKAIINPILDNDGNIIEFIGIRTDVTELENAMIAALSGERAKSAFLATMSHELRTPLNAVIGFSQILMTKDNMSMENVKMFVEKINLSGKHLLNIVNNILDFSKIESGKMELNKKEILLESFINNTILLLENEALKKEIKIVKEDFSNISLTIDEQLLRQVILNILSNAIKFSSNNSTINLSYNKDEKNHIIKICDNGVGLSQEEIKKLFKPFSQIQGHQNGTAKGTGLGLVISQKIAQLHDGKIEVESKENRGSCFSILLPILKS